MSYEVCAVHSCTELVHARHLCRHHYRAWQRQALTDPHTTLAGYLSTTRPERDPEPLVCVCLVPEPDGIGECQLCHRKVVTYASANREVYQQTYPVEWHRAVQLNLFPELGYPDIVVAERP